MNFWVWLHHIGIFELFVLTFQSITSSNLLSRFYPFFFSKIWSCYLWYLEDDDKVGEGGDGGAKKRKGNTQIQRKYVFWCGFYWPLDGVSITCCSSGKKMRERMGGCQRCQTYLISYAYYMVAKLCLTKQQHKFGIKWRNWNLFFLFLFEKHHNVFYSM